jgi:hypothetical protein
MCQTYRCCICGHRHATETNPKETQNIVQHVQAKQIKKLEGGGRGSSPTPSAKDVFQETKLLALPLTYLCPRRDASALTTSSLTAEDIACLLNGWPGVSSTFLAVGRCSFVCHVYIY